MWSCGGYGFCRFHNLRVGIEDLVVGFGTMPAQLLQCTWIGVWNFEHLWRLHMKKKKIRVSVILFSSFVWEKCGVRFVYEDDGGFRSWIWSWKSFLHGFSNFGSVCPKFSWLRVGRCASNLLWVEHNFTNELLDAVKFLCYKDCWNRLDFTWICTMWHLKMQWQRACHWFTAKTCWVNLCFLVVKVTKISLCAPLNSHQIPGRAFRKLVWEYWFL